MADLEETLVSVLQNRPERSEVLVVLNNEYDDPYNLRDEVRFVPSRADVGLMGSLAGGLAAAEGPVIHLLGCGMEVVPNWTESAMTHFEQANVAAVAPLVAPRRSPARIASAGVEYRPAGYVRRLSAGRTATVGLNDKRAAAAPDHLAAFYRRDLLEQLVELAEPSDTEFGAGDLAAATAWLIDQRNMRCVMEPTSRAYAPDHLLRRADTFRAGMADQRVFRRWRRDDSPAMALLEHAAMLTGEFAQSFVRPKTLLRLAGRAATWLGLGANRSARATCVRWRCAMAMSESGGTDRETSDAGRLQSVEDASALAERGALAEQVALAEQSIVSIEAHRSDREAGRPSGTLEDAEASRRRCA